MSKAILNFDIMRQENLVILDNRQIAEDIFSMTLRGGLVRQMEQPGQFLHIKPSKGILPLLRRPISICSVDLKKEEVTVVYRAQGEGTRLMASMKSGDEMDVLGPLGHGFPTAQLANQDQVLLVGGGVGVPPLYYLSQQLVSRGIQVTHILGFQAQQNTFLIPEFEALGETYVTTMDGSAGHKGLVSDLFDQWPKTGWASIFSCGPIPMLKAVEDYFRDQQHVYLSLEQRMGCGIGACFACVCPTAEHETSYRKVCSDGPVFKAGEVML